MNEIILRKDSAIETRREISQKCDLSTLNTIERNIYTASTEKAVKEISDSNLVEQTARMFKMIAYDVGYIIPKDAMWQYVQTRLLEIIKKYYGDMTLSDVKMAFELASIGELDNYLPRDSRGNPERHHYQQFNADYFSRILNAYRKKQNDVFDKVFKALPRKDTPERVVQYYERARMERNRNIYLRYKYTGKAEFILSDETFLYDWLSVKGLANEITATESDRKQAYNRFLKRVADGFVNKDMAFFVSRQGTKSKEIDFTAYEIARRREIINTFDRMIRDEIQIDKLIR